MNPTNLQIAQFQFTLHVARLIEHIYDKNYLCTFGETFRTQEQAKWYADKGLGIVDSYHCKRLAVDLNLFDRNEFYVTDGKSYEQFGIFWESLSHENVWGGRFKRQDFDHFERRYEDESSKIKTLHECDGCCIPK